MQAILLLDVILESVAINEVNFYSQPNEFVTTN
jgi:hypothetical protein